MDSHAPALGVGMVGYAFMGAAHSQAWRTAPHFFDLPLRPRMLALCGRDSVRVNEAAGRLGWETTETDWTRLVARDDIDLVDICTPGNTHVDIAVSALEAGKHVLCEKPLANTVAEAEAMAAAAERAAQHGVRSMVGFTYRRTPAIGLARRLVEEGRIGEVRHVRAQYLQDWLTDPASPMTWRLEKDKAGSGALGDIGAHIVDLTQYITGDRIVTVNGLLETFVGQRPVAGAGSGSLLGGDAVNGTGAELGEVTVDDTAVFLARFGSGAVGVFEATRFATGRKNAIRVEINGSKGSLAFDFEDMNVLQFFDAEEPSETAGFRRILVTEPQHPYVGSWWPPGHGLGYEHGFTHQVVDLVRAIGQGVQPLPSFADGLQVQRVLAAVESSSETGSWQTTAADDEQLLGTH
ncbi:Gfo/Idh/MocA family protein [Marmoricola sp. URHB0036]|uniref:Gfo/Idh/MocA family protein n=1 Tax=Marmoricola sp. URHB0036 TaxID=1298863 RepID=UPI00041A64AA|nr:Gfo/Idh/MocA family oxidoreductase [Marmoricola sp. URHB0036]